MNDAELLTLFKKGLNEVAPGREAEFDKVTMETNMDDLGMDSVSLMELVGYVEQHVGKTFPDDRLANLVTFRDLASLVSS